MNGAKVYQLYQKLAQKIKQENYEVEHESGCFSVKYLGGKTFGFELQFDYQSYTLKLDVQHDYDETNLETCVEKTVSLIYSLLLEEKLDVFFYSDTQCYCDMEKATERAEKWHSLYSTGVESINLLKMLKKMPLAYDYSKGTFLLKHEFPWENSFVYARTTLHPFPVVEFFLGSYNETRLELYHRSDEFLITACNTYQDYEHWIREQQLEQEKYNQKLEEIRHVLLAYFDKVEYSITGKSFTCFLKGDKTHLVSLSWVMNARGSYYSLFVFDNQKDFDRIEDISPFLVTWLERFIRTEEMLRQSITAWMKRDPSSFIDRKRNFLSYFVVSFGIQKVIDLDVLTNGTYRIKTTGTSSVVDDFETLEQNLSRFIENFIAEHRMGLLFNNETRAYVLKMKHCLGLEIANVENISTKLTVKEVNQGLAAFDFKKIYAPLNEIFLIGDLYAFKSGNVLHLENDLERFKIKLQREGVMV
jgi:hypothetical protein